MEETKVFDRLAHITNELDQAVKTIRLAENDTTNKVKGWVLLWFILPFMSMGNLKALTKLKTLDLSPGLPMYIGVGLYSILVSVTSISPILLAIWIFIGAYAISFAFLAPRAMCNFKSGYFRFKAYALFRNQEYELLKSALAEGDEFYFRSIPRKLGLIIQNNQHYKHIYEQINAFVNQEKRDWEIRLERAIAISDAEKEDYKMALEEFDDEVGSLVDELSEVHLTLKYLIEFIKNTNTALYRMHNDCFSVADLVNMVGTGVTIYELIEQESAVVLQKIYDEGTSGISPQFITLDQPLAAAKVVNEGKFEEHIIDEPSEGRFVVSRLFKMGYNKVWVINFHPDFTQEKALLLTIPNEELNTREIMRVIHSMCLLMQENDHLKKGDS
ncbi:hypothetical protein NLX67_14985 [Domibacillus sp. A3M-37]|uniref:hypothetical protein n=1 Tax=Domibacillus sp. A3M-37 TaxID=2962037 RepID=UPI0020B685ED|nr:hypothetical protein [Domibacillus sp. A3M-37]MCP3763679.1 hypothetical protein [Domibacillus sp. A3M-37]